MSLLDELEMLEKAATTAPWADAAPEKLLYELNVRWWVPGIASMPVVAAGHDSVQRANAEFIAAARNALPQLLAVARAAADALYDTERFHTNDLAAALAPLLSLSKEKKL